MKVAHILLDGASHYDRTCHAIDRVAHDGSIQDSFGLCSDGSVVQGTATSLKELGRLLGSGEFALMHVHGSTRIPGRLLAGLQIPWITDRSIPMPRSFLRRFPKPSAVLFEREVPESVSEEYFVAPRAERVEAGRSRIGTFVRGSGIRNNVEQAAARIQRFREDIEWIPFDSPPSPQDLSGLDLWVDPALEEDDLDGMVGEAIACGTPVVATRTAPNVSRLDGGRAGLLAPPNDHNELVHAVLNALFKDELADPCRSHAMDIRDRFRPAERRTALRMIYAELTR